jgi:hypothetical protein
VRDLLSREGLSLYERWFDRLQQLTPGEKVLDTAVRDEMPIEKVHFVAERNSLIWGKKVRMMGEEVLNRFLRGKHLLG